MPWEHCGQEILDDLPCPTCGIDKGQWTVNFDLTRTFVVASRRPLLKILLTNLEDAPVPREACHVVFPNDETAEHELDEFGYTKAVSPVAGQCRLTFPYWAEGEVEQIPEDEPESEAGSDTEREPAEASGDPRGSSEPVETPACFEVPTRAKKYRFRVVVPYLDVELVDESNTPVPDRAYELRSAEEVIVEDTLGERGWARVRGIDEGEYELSLPGMSRSTWNLRSELESESTDSSDAA